MKKQHIPYYLAAAAALATAALYLPALRNDFVLWDDDAYVTGNVRIRSMDLSFFRWAFTSFYMGTWHPLTWISHALDYTLWGLDPRGHHLTSIVLHALNAFLIAVLSVRLLEAWRRTGSGRAAWQGVDGDRRTWVAAAVAGLLFGLHPLHVEPVAWISGRKDLLCTFFFLLAVLNYTKFADAASGRDGGGRAPMTGRHYLLTAGFFVLALLSKGMAVTLPLVLLILDWHPFGRIRTLRSLGPALVEKIPLLLLAGAASVMSVLANASPSGEAAHASLLTRSFVAAQSVVLYAAKTAFPVHLTPFYAYPRLDSPFSFEYLATTCLAAGVLLLFALLGRRSKVWPAVGGFYVVTLLPVAGIIQIISYHALADRYSYLPGAGLFLLLGLGGVRLWEKAKERGGVFSRGPAAVAAALCIALSFGTLRQIAVWNNSITLWSAVIESDPDHVPGAYHNRGLAFRDRGQLDRAIDDFTSALALDPGTANNYNSRGLTFAEMGRFLRALEDLDRAVELDPGFADAYTSRGWTYWRMGLTDRALEDYTRAIALDPARAVAYNDRGMVYQATGRIEQAIEDFTSAIRSDPYFAEAYTNRGLAREQAGRMDEAFQDYTAALRADPSFANAYNNRGLIFARAGQLDKALEDFNAAMRLKPAGAEVLNNRALVFEGLGRLDRAIEDYDRAIELDPQDALSYSSRGAALARAGMPDRAIEDYSRAVSLQPDLVRAYLERGQLFRSRGDRAGANKDFQKACALGSREGCTALRGR